MATLNPTRRPLTLVAKITLAVVLVIAVFLTSGIDCWGGRCACTPRLVDTYFHPYSRSGVLAVNAQSRLLYSSADDAMAIAVLDADDAMGGPLFSVPTEGYLGGVALDETGNKVYVPQGFSKSVRVVDGNTHVHHDIMVPAATNAIGSLAVDPARRRLYVVRNDDLNVALFDTASERYLGSVASGCCTTPSMLIGVDRSTGVLLVLDTGDGTLSAFDANGDRIASLDVEGPPLRFTVDSDQHRAYIAVDQPQQVTVVDIDPASGTAFTVLAHIPLRDRPTDIALDPAAHIGYVANSGTNTLTLIDLAANRRILDLPIGHQPGYLAVDTATARVFVALANQGVAIVQGCPAARRRLSGLRGMFTRPTSRPSPRSIATPVDHSSPTEAALRRAYVRGERMFVNRTQCLDGVTTYEAAEAVTAIATAGARVVDAGAAGQMCGVGTDFPQPDMAAAGYFFSVPVLEPGAEVPTVWTFESATRTLLTTDRPATLHVTRSLEAPTTPWRESLWWLSRCKTKVPEAECAR
ncbi:MAG: YncE family protein [Ardenticatenales bacterium]|nr:YncE family protein [Ardenticatenales bacterium]